MSFHREDEDIHELKINYPHETMYQYKISEEKDPDIMW